MKLGIQAIAFDAYGTLFDVYSVIALCEGKLPGRGSELCRLWCAKQLEYTWLRSLSGQCKDFWIVTESALALACRSLNLACPPRAREELMESYLHLDIFSDVTPALAKLSQDKLAILSTGSPRMLSAAVDSASLTGIFTDLISVDQVKIYKTRPRVYGLVSQHLGGQQCGRVCLVEFLGDRWRQKLWVLDLLREPRQASRRGIGCHARCHGDHVVWAC